VALIINHNLMAMNAAQNLDTAYNSLSKATNELSSGLRINNAADDAAGLAIRELMRSDIATLNQGVRNANDAISLLQTADGALGVVDEKLIRMQELAEQAATGTYTSTQRLIIDSEYQAMASEITRIANATDFNGIYLLNGNLSGSTANGKIINPTGKLKVHFGIGNSSSSDYYYIQIGCCTASALGLGLGASGGGMTEAQFAAGFTSVGSGSFNTFIQYGNTPANIQNQFSPTQTMDEYDNENGTEYLIGKDTSGQLHALSYRTADDSFIGDQNLSLSGSGSGRSISTQYLAEQALGQIQDAIVSKDKIRANLGALENRLANTVTNLQIQSQNLQGAESQISDVDVATEMTEFVREQILTQSATAMLAQANSLPKIALQLIQGG
jgi:flagellin